MPGVDPRSNQRRGEEGVVDKAVHCVWFHDCLVVCRDFVVSRIFGRFSFTPRFSTVPLH